MPEQNNLSKEDQNKEIQNNTSEKNHLLEIAEKWQKKWHDNSIFSVKTDKSKKKFYCLEMYPYPSGKLHMGHVRTYSLGDCFARYKRMNGFNVLYPMGYDSFGLPAENAAIKNNANPREWTDKRMNDMVEQQKSLGLSYDWSRKVYSHDPDYYRWNQWFFIQMLKKGLAYKKKAVVNWCPECNTVLANEQVQDGKCWRHSDTDVEQKELAQWYIKTTEYADELLENIDNLDGWPEKVKTMQRNWIGKSEGTIIKFDVVDENNNKVDEIETFTTRPDTVFGITYLVLAAEHPKALEYSKGTAQEEKIKEFIRETRKRSVIDRTAEGKEKNGVFLGKYFINPVNGEKFPLWIADYALMEYGTGAVMAVPTHDQRDFEFAKKYNLPLKVVISPLDGWELNPEKMTRAYITEGKLINSSDFNGLHNKEAIGKISDWMESKGYGYKTTTYKLRDWLISRQRYWGTPIPMIYCSECGTVPEKEENLPVKLPEDVDFTKGGNPLESSESFINCKCPKCGKEAKRETDTMDTFVDSSWYFLRYTDEKRENMFNKEQANYWMPVDQYIGGIEHACMHLIYARFFTKALRDLGMVDIDEPFKKLLTQGMVIKDGAKMSKSIGNVVDPGVILERFGPDTARLFILFASLPEKELDWNDKGVEGSYRFLMRYYSLKDISMSFDKPEPKNETDKFILSRLNRTIKEYTEDIEKFRFSTALGKLMSLVNDTYSYSNKQYDKNIMGICVKNITLMLSPAVPHVCEEVWEKIGMDGFCSLAEWPLHDENMIDDKSEYSMSMVDGTISDIRHVLKLIGKDNPSKVTLFISESWKYGFFSDLKKAISETRDIGVIMKQVMDNEHKKEISSIVPKIVKNISKLPEVVLDQEKEFEAINEYKQMISDEFNCDIQIIKAEDSDNPKAKQAIPGKPSLIVE